MARILVAEDEVAVREFIRRVLETRGHAVVAVADGAEALVKLSRDNFDLLLADIAMPNMDGVELTLKATRDWPNLTVLLMSGIEMERRRAHGIGQLAHAILRKPFSMVDLVQAVEAALEIAADAD
ncbi:response regulator [Ferrovibrio sp.]|jgi:two-component system cell cycle response regulator CpdR|uniref:response regulator n=1 Tax=Ferrovibrio sp. TaxID=1917215 RepID=UPI0035B36D05